MSNSGVESLDYVESLDLRLTVTNSRSEGKEEATKIRAETDKERTILLAEAYEKEQTIRGEGDKEAIRIQAEAFNKDPKFYAFIRSMQAYKKSFQTDTTVLLSEKSEFLRFLNKAR